MVSSLRVLSLPCALLLSALYTRAMAFERAVEVPQVSRRQQAFLGGWAIGIAGTECPSDVPVLCTGSIKNPACCPTGTFCFGLANTYCCPTDTDCAGPVTNFPKCADPSWTMYILVAYSDYFFCCPKGQFGVLPLSSKYGGLCVVDGEPIAASRLATKVASALTTKAITTRTSETLTITSTSNGRATTYTTVVTSRVTYTQTTNPFGVDVTTVPSNTGTTTSSSTSTSSNPPAASGGLSTGAIAGIVIGGLGVLALFVVAFLLYRRRKPASPTPAPDYTTYAPPTHQQQPDMGVYPKTHQQQPDMGVYPTQHKSPAISNAGTATVVGSPAPQHVQPQQQPQHGYEHYGPPPPAAGYSEVQGQNTWDGPGRAEIGPGR